MTSQHDHDRLADRKSAGFDTGLRERIALLHRFAREFLMSQWKRLAIASIAMVAYAGTMVALPVVFQRLVDQVLIARDGTALPSLVSFIVAVFAVRAAAAFAQQYTLAYVANGVSLALQRRLAHHLLSLDLSFFKRNSVGQLISRATDDVAVLNRSATNIVIIMVRDLVSLIGLLVYIFWVDPIWALLALIGGPLIAVPISLANRKMRALSRRGQNLGSEILQAFEEALHSIRSIKAEHLEDVERRRLDQIITGRRKVAMRFARTQAVVMPVVDLVTAGALVTVVMLGGSEVVSGEADPGHLIAFASALMLLYEPLRRLLSFNAQLQAATVSLHRIYEVLDKRATIVDAPDAALLHHPGGAIRLEDVSFSYDGEVPVLSGLTAEIPAGATAAFVGPSGSGKTTIFNLLARLNEPDAGRVTIGGQDIAGVSLGSLRSNLALVSQDVLLFDAPVADNLTYGHPAPEPQAVRAAVAAAEATEFIAQLPEGPAFRVGPRGSRLSGGQRQRIALARALLRDAPILLLDEASSALDSDSEARVQENLAAMREGRTTILIAHRLATVIGADVIFVMENGRIVEQGTHTELMIAGGAYARAFAQQSG